MGGSRTPSPDAQNIIGPLMPHIRFLGIFLISLICLGISLPSNAVSLGSANLLSAPGEALRVEIPINLAANEQQILESLNASIPLASAFERLGISSKILNYNAQVMVYRTRDERLMVLIETVQPIPVSDDLFLDALINLNWSSGSLTKAYTFLIGSFQKIIVQPGQSLSQIATGIRSEYGIASTDQAMLALYQANPDAFKEGNINFLMAGAELVKPTNGAVQAIGTDQAREFSLAAKAKWLEENKYKTSVQVSGEKSSENPHEDAKLTDHLKISSSSDKDVDKRRITEEIVAQEKILEQTKVKTATIEKSIADLQKLLSDIKPQTDNIQATAPVFVGFELKNTLMAIAGLLALLGLLVWFLMRSAAKPSLTDVDAHDSGDQVGRENHHHPHKSLSDKAEALFEEIDLNLDPPVRQVISPESFRVKLNLAKAYLTIEDFSAAENSLNEILAVSDVIDAQIIFEAKSMLVEIQSRTA
jgi:pilus assembly protein FimV